MYSETAMYPRSPDTRQDDQGGRYWGRATATFDRILLMLGAIALLLLVPVLWIWLLYGSGLGPGAVYGGGIGLCVVTVAIGFAMIRLLEGGR